jgi:hypothetical protein
MVGRLFEGRGYGASALVLTLAGQALILLAIVFAPDEPIYERPTEEHWTDTVGEPWLVLSLAAMILAVVGLVRDRRRLTAGLALLAAFIGFLWPWGA